MSAGQATDSDPILRGERRVLELIATGASLHDVLDAICRTLDDPPASASAIYLLDRDGEHLKFAAGPSLGDPWRSTTRLFPAAGTADTSERW